MTKRFICFLLAAALLACSAFAAAPETSPEPTAQDQYKLRRPSAASSWTARPAPSETISISTSALRRALFPENPKIATASGTAVQCYVADDEDGIYDYYFSSPTRT